MTYKDLNLKTKQIIKSIPQLLLSNILLVVLLVIGIISLFIIYFNVIASYFYDNTTRVNGQLLGTVLTFIGGCAVIYGLYLNNKRIKEQNRQNNIADKTNNDKRFGDAIGYLNSDNAGVAIGGVYALYQLAKEDDRYVLIVANVFSKSLFILGTKSRFEEVCNIIVDLVFGDIFKEVCLSFQDIIFHNVRIENTRNKSFNSCSFIDIDFHNIEHFDFRNCIISDSKFNSVSHIHFVKNIIKHCHILNLGNCYLKKIEMYDNEIASLNIYSQMQIDELYLKKNKISFNLKISTSIIKNSYIDASPKLELESNNQEKVEIDGDKKQIKQSEFKDVIAEFLDIINK